MGKIFKVKDNKSAEIFARAFVKGIGKPIKQALPYFQQLAIMIDTDTQNQFRSQGARSGKPWKLFNNGRGAGFYDTKKGSTTRTAKGTWNIRYGTDKNPKRNKKQLRAYKTANDLWFKSGKMKGYESDTRYALNSKLLQKSGDFRKSFKATKITKNMVKYETNHELAGKIGKYPERQILAVTANDIRRYTAKFKSFVSKGIVF